MKPMDFDRFTAPRTVCVVDGTPLDQAVRDALRDPILEHYAVVELDGVAVERANWAGTILTAGSLLRVALRPRGETGKKILRTVLLIAVVAVAAWISGPKGVALIGSKTAAAIASAGFAAVASLAINALIPPPGLGDGARQDLDPTYSLTGTRNQARPSAAIPVILGSHRFTPDLVTEQYQEVVGDDIWLRFGVCWGVGRVEVEDIRIGDTPIREFDGIQIQHQLTPEAPPTTLIRGDFTQDSVGATLDTDWVTRRTAADAADAEILVQFPRGLGTQDDKGKPQSVGVTIQVRVRVVNADDSVGDWSDIGTADPIIADRVAESLGTTSRGDFFYRGGFGIPSNAYDQYVAALRGHGGASLSKTYRRSDIKPFSAMISIALPPGPQFDISVRRTTTPDDTTTVADQAVWAGLTTWQTAPVVTEPRLATSFFRIKAQDQLTGFIDELNGLVHSLAPTYNGPEDSGLAEAAHWDGAAPRTTNPADLMLAAMQGLHNVTPTPDDEIHWGDLARFWLWCRDEALRFSLPIDGGLSRGEVLDMIARAGRARTFRHNGKIRIAIDRPRPEGPSQILTPRNARNFNFTRTFAAPVHALRMPFTNADDDYRDDEIIVYAERQSAETATLIEDVPSPGVLHVDQIHGYGKYLLAQMASRTLIATCDMDIEFETVKLGDYVRLAHPVLDETVLSARALAVTGRVVELDTEHFFDAEQDYVLRHRRIMVKDDEAWLDCQGLYPLTALSGWAQAVTLVDDLPTGVTVNEDDLLVIGIAGQDSFEGLIRDIEPSGPGQASVELVAYLPETLIAPPAGAHTPRGVAPFPAVPSPILVGVSLSESDVSVAFTLPDSAAGRIARFEARTRALPNSAAGETGAWSRLPNLPAAARTLSAPIAAPDQVIEIEITAVDIDDRRSLPLLVQSGDKAPAIPAPANPMLTPGTIGDPSGSRVPVLNVSVDPVDTTRLAQLVVESRTSGTVEAWTIVATASSAQARVRVFGLPPGSTLDIRLAWQTPRGVLTPESARPVISDIEIPDTLVASGIGDFTVPDIRASLVQVSVDAFARTTGLQIQTDASVVNYLDLLRSYTAREVQLGMNEDQPNFAKGKGNWLADDQDNPLDDYAGPGAVGLEYLPGDGKTNAGTPFEKDVNAQIARLTFDVEESIRKGLE